MTRQVLYDAILSGDKNLALFCIAASLPRDIASLDSQTGLTALHAVAHKGDIAWVQLLLWVMTLSSFLSFFFFLSSFFSHFIIIVIIFIISMVPMWTSAPTRL